MKLSPTLCLANFLFLFATSVTAFAQSPTEEQTRNWHQWRGPFATGEAVNANPPLEWSETKNVRWKKEIEGLGNSTPIIWGDKLFLTTAIDTGKADPALPKPEDQPPRKFGITFPNTYFQFVVICLDRNTGDELWRKVATEQIPNEGHHGDNSFATPSPTTDGEKLFCWFGSQGLFCFDLDGDKLWEKNFGKVSTRLSFGEGSSPVVHGDRLIVNRDNEGQSYVLCLDAKTGDELWRQNRNELSSWATPLIVEAAGKTQVILNATNRVRSYDLANGDLIWEGGGQVSNVTPCPVTDGKYVYCMSGYRGSSAMAIPLDSTGDVTGSDDIVWTLGQGTPYVPSPLLVDGTLYFNQSNNAILTKVDADTGNVLLERTRLPDVRGLYSSPVAAAGRIYITGRDGETIVLDQQAKFEVLATNRLNDRIDASAAIVDDAIYLRGKTTVYCIGE